jgi:hypothetical protein
MDPLEIAFTPATMGALRLDLTSSKSGKEQFKDSRRFIIQGK